MENSKERETRLVDSKIAAVRKREPILKDPEGLTDNIMNAIRENPMQNNFDDSEKSTKLPVIIILRRLLAAASVCLFLVFGYEEYVVVDKISRLEKQNAAISRSSQYQAALNLNKAMIYFINDPEILDLYKKLKTRKLSLQTVFKAAMYVDMAFIDPGTLNLYKSKVDLPPNSNFISVLKGFDSIQNNIRR